MSKVTPSWREEDSRLVVEKCPLLGSPAGREEEGSVGGWWGPGVESSLCTLLACVASISLRRRGG